jgi:hypothetical protein
LRLITLLVLVWLVVREILHPEMDVVRHSYPDDPDGGVLDGAPDRDDIDMDRFDADEFDRDRFDGGDFDRDGAPAQA